MAEPGQDGSGKLDPTERLLRACRGEAVDRPPVWLMSKSPSSRSGGWVPRR